MLAEPLPAGSVFVEDGSNPQIIAGNSTIGGLGTPLKRHNPDIRLVGVQSAPVPYMALSFAAGEPVDTETCATFASGMAVRVAVPQAVELMHEVVD